NDTRCGHAGDDTLLGMQGDDRLDSKDGHGGDLVQGGPGQNHIRRDHGDPLHPENDEEVIPIFDSIFFDDPFFPAVDLPEEAAPTTEPTTQPTTEPTTQPTTQPTDDSDFPDDDFDHFGDCDECF